MEECLDDLELEELPPIATDVVNLSCSMNQLHTLPIFHFGLVILDCSHNFITKLPPLPPTLKELYCYGNELLELPELHEGLEVLNCIINRITILPTLKCLECSDNRLSTLPELPINLKILKCDRNRLKKLPILPEGLEILLCYGNSLPAWALDSSLRKVKKKQYQVVMKNLKSAFAAVIIQRCWTKYWLIPNQEGEARYAKHAYQLSIGQNGIPI